MATDNEPIVAVATSLHKAPVAIIRISGENLTPFLKLFNFPKPRIVQLHDYLVDDELIDSGLVIYFKSPHSFTGEDVIEFHGHGSKFVLERVLSELKKMGARYARPGEFSERAFLNGKMDLVQAEAIADLIDAKSLASSKAALRTISGAFSEKIHRIESALRHLRALVEGAIDFSDEEIEFIESQSLEQELTQQLSQLEELHNGAQKGRYLRDGVKVALIGPPNVGKSTLLNALIGEERAITSDIAGTTRDVVDADFEINGVPMTILDTAGIRQSDDPIEKMGIARSFTIANDANIIIQMAQFNEPFLEDIETEGEVIRVMNKVDEVKNEHSDALAISAKDATGLPELKREILNRLELNDVAAQQFSARDRHIDAIVTAQAHIKNAIKNNAHEVGVELVAEEIRLAHDALGEITGVVHSDDILGDIFSSFCIGK